MVDISTDLLSEDKDGYRFEVTVSENGSSTTHMVEVSDDDYNKLTGGNIKPDVLVKKSFEFLIAREPKESILSNFNLMEISQYFPEYVEEAESF